MGSPARSTAACDRVLVEQPIVSDANHRVYSCDGDMQQRSFVRRSFGMSKTHQNLSEPPSHLDVGDFCD